MQPAQQQENQGQTCSSDNLEQSLCQLHRKKLPSKLEALIVERVRVQRQQGLPINSCRTQHQACAAAARIAGNRTVLVEDLRQPLDVESAVLGNEGTVQLAVAMPVRQVSSKFVICALICALQCSLHVYRRSSVDWPTSDYKRQRTLKSQRTVPVSATGFCLPSELATDPGMGTTRSERFADSSCASDLSEKVFDLLDSFGSSCDRKAPCGLTNTCDFRAPIDRKSCDLIITAAKPRADVDPSITERSIAYQIKSRCKQSAVINHSVSSARAKHKL